MANIIEIIPPAKFETYEQLVLSGQIDVGRFMKLMDRNPEFKAWYKARALKRCAQE